MSVISLKTLPAELIATSLASHVVTPSCFLNVNGTVGAREGYYFS
jgi:hypothetical protein